MSLPCCPPDSTGYLAPDYQTVGSIMTLSDGTDIYTSGSGRAGIIFVPDVFGWNSGRTRNIADMFATAGYHSVVPKLLGPGLEGGTDGDGLPPDFDTGKRRPEFFAYVSQFTWAVLGPRIASCIAHLKSCGVEKIGMVGYCWGGWVVVQALADYSDDLATGVIPHPSIHLEDMLGRSALALCQNCKRPVLLMPASNDPDSYDENGANFQALKVNNPESETVRFGKVKHGWVPRGDLEDPDVKEAVDEAVQRMFAYFSRFLQ